MLHLFSIQNKKEMKKRSKATWRERDDDSQLGPLLCYIVAAQLHRLRSAAPPTPILGLFWEGVMVRYETLVSADSSC